MNIFTKFHKDWTTIVDFLLIANFGAILLFFWAPSSMVNVNMYLLWCGGCWIFFRTCNTIDKTNPTIIYAFLFVPLPLSWNDVPCPLLFWETTVCCCISKLFGQLWMPNLIWERHLLIERNFNNVVKKTHKTKDSITPSNQARHATNVIIRNSNWYVCFYLHFRLT